MLLSNKFPAGGLKLQEFSLLYGSSSNSDHIDVFRTKIALYHSSTGIRARPCNGLQKPFMKTGQKP